MAEARCRNVTRAAYLRLLGLAAQESRDLELIVGVLVMHRSRPAMLVEALRHSALGVFRHRLDPLSRPLPLRQRRHLRTRRRPLGLLVARLLAPAEADRGEAGKQRHARLVA